MSYVNSCNSWRALSKLQNKKTEVQIKPKKPKKWLTSQNNKKAKFGLLFFTFAFKYL